MIDESILQDALKEYRKYFVQPDRGWVDEQYKWKAIRYFRDHWDIKASDFPGMLKESLSKTSNLLRSQSRFPAQMIEDMAEAAPEEVRKMFQDLFEGNGDVVDRIEDFKQAADQVFEKYGTEGKKHFQDENSISTYLWLRFPDEYYIYKFSEVNNVSTVLKSDHTFKKGDDRNNLVNFYALYDELCDYITKDEETTSLVKQYVDQQSECYPDPKYKTLTVDVGFFISRFYTDILKQRENPVTNTPVTNTDDTEWYPADYSPKLSVEDWLELINNGEVFYQSSLEIMKRLLDIGGQATCKQLSNKYGENFNFYLNGSVALAKRVAAQTHCPVMHGDNDNARWWPILYVGKDAGQKDAGIFIWRLRPELKEALQQTDLTDVKLYAKQESEEPHYWWLTVNPEKEGWNFSMIQVGEREPFDILNDKGNQRKIHRNFLAAREGDPVIGYETVKNKRQIVALARISAPSNNKSITIEKTEDLSSPIDLQDLKTGEALKKLKNMEVFQNPEGTLFKLTKDEYEYIMKLVREKNPKAVSTPNQSALETYTEKNFLHDVYMSEEHYHDLKGLLEYKKNIILQGPPGVGKTYAAKRLAYSIMGVKDDSRIETVQFHQNYSYEDFMLGYRPTSSGFKLEHGIFYRFCKKAEKQPGEKFFFLIDEINRGNISKIFGELMMLLEKDHRNEHVDLPYVDTETGTNEQFSIPENVYLIGTMNTADRSLAMMDYALRRRFGFFEMEPAFEVDSFKKYQDDLGNRHFDNLINEVKALNDEITDDSSLGKGCVIGHSYFCGLEKKEDCTDQWMKSIIDYEIVPLLEEYWFDDKDRVTDWKDALHGAVK